MMADDKKHLVESLVRAIPQLTAGQLNWINRAVKVFSASHEYYLKNSSLFDEITLQNFGDALRIHHSFSAEPLSKDKFEYVFVRVLEITGHKATLAPKGNAGYDVTVNGVRLALKTQADKDVRENILWISKFMELGKGRWGDDPADLRGLRDQFLRHIRNYDRILSLRPLSRRPNWKYELVEVPKTLLALARAGVLEMKAKSRQFPKPGYCHVRNAAGEALFDLYFDGGSERKLPIKNLSKQHCMVHATWEFFIPTE